MGLPCCESFADLVEHISRMPVRYLDSGLSAGCARSPPPVANLDTMKLNIVRLLQTLLLACVCILKSQGASDEFMKMDLKSAIVEVKYSSGGYGSTTTGTKTTWYADYGRKQATVQKETVTTKVFGMGSTEETETLTIMDGEYVYTIDLKKKTGMRMSMAGMKNFAAGYTEEVERQGKTMEQHADEMVKQFNGKWLGEGKVLGRTCRILEMWGIKQWLYKQIPLKVEGNIMGVKTQEEATSIKENVSISADRFKVPSGIEMTDAPDIAGMFQTKEAGQAMAGGEGQDLNGLAALIAQAQQQAEAEAGKSGSKTTKKDGSLGGLAGLLAQAQAQAEAEEKAAGESGEASEEGEAGPAGISYADFKKKLKGVSIEGVRKPIFTSEDGEHEAQFSKNLTNWVMVTASGLVSKKELRKSMVEEQDENNPIEEQKSYKWKGRDAFYVVIGAEGVPVKTSMIFVLDPETKTTWRVHSIPLRDREELEKVLEQLF